MFIQGIISQLSQLVPLEMRACFQVEINHRYHREGGSKQVCVSERGDFGDIPTQQHADSDTYVPRSEVSAGSRGALVIGGKVYE